MKGWRERGAGCCNKYQVSTLIVFQGKGKKTNRVARQRGREGETRRS